MEKNVSGISGYNRVDSFCRMNSVGGGVIVFSRNGVVVEKCSSFSQFQVEGECEFCVVRLSTLNIFVIVLYRPPKGDVNIFLNNIESLFTQLNRKQQVKIMLIGDFNIDFASTTSIQNDCLSLMRSYDLNPKCRDMTRVNRVSATMIDNIFTIFRP